MRDQHLRAKEGCKRAGCKIQDGTCAVASSEFQWSVPPFPLCRSGLWFRLAEMLPSISF